MPEAPEYKVYRSRKSPFGFLRRDEPGGIWDLRRERRGPRTRPRKPLSVGRVVKWLVVAALSWILFSALVFLVSAQFAEHSSGSTASALSPGGTLLSGSTVLVLGSDARPPNTKEPGAVGPARSDSIMLMHVGFGSVRKVSILRDSRADIPGHGAQKINAAYALGGAGLAIRTIEQFMGNGLKVNHVLEISFQDFPKLIDSLGGITVHLRRCIHSNQFGGKVLVLHRGDQHLTGHQALQFSRVRENRCARNEDDRTRAARQQQVLSAIRSRILSPTAFIRLPWVAWAAPRTVRSDMRGPGLSMLFADLITSRTGKPHVLLPSGANGTELIVSDAAKQRAMAYLNGG
ncbi:MAG: LCP family protein [Thermoleophilaceae bacterium]